MLDEPITDEALALKDALRDKRDQINISNQEIADRSGLSIHTVNNYFSSRSKASSAFTVGKICMALHISFDRAFGIVPDDSPEESANLSRIAELEQKCKDYKKDLAHSNEIISLKDTALKEAQAQIEHRRPVIRGLIIIIAILSSTFLLYLLHFDLSNPNYGIFRG